MITTDMRDYDYYIYGAKDKYGQLILDQSVKGKIKMAIYISSQSVQDNINYKDCRYVGFTNEPIDASYVIQYGDQKLKVLYTVPGRRTNVFLTNYEH